VKLEGYITEVKDGGLQNQYRNERETKTEDSRKPC